MKNKLKITPLILFAAIMLFSLFGCSESKKASNTVPVTQPTTAVTTAPTSAAEKTTVKLDKNELTLQAGATAFLEPVVSPAQKACSTVFESDNKAVAIVDSAGRVDALAVGQARITVRAGGGSAVCKITVTPSSKNNADMFSTAFTANEQQLNENIENGYYMSLYKIEVNRLKNCVTVYTYDNNGDYTVPVRAMICSTGKDNATVTGEFEIGVKYRWLPLFGDVYGQYVSGFYGNFLFHSVPYEQESPDSLETKEYNLLGAQASMGCVRLAAADAKWIYDNCEEGTAVVVFDSETDGPLGTPQAMTINDSLGWDPTDDDEQNPYRTKTPVIIGASDKTIKKGEKIGLFDGITAKDTCGNDITNEIKLTGSVITGKEGVYRLTYRVTDSMHRTAKQDITVTVTE